MRFRVLGAVQASTADVELAIPGERVRTLLAALLLRPGQVVADEQLLYDVWGEELPSNPRSAMQAAISRLRRALSGVELRNELGGYRLDLTGHDLDLMRFRDGVAEAARPEDRAEARLLIGQVDEALAELTSVTADSPLREHAWWLLMKGLQQSGRTAEALAAYDRVRQVLAEELGTDLSLPSPTGSHTSSSS